MGLYIETQQQEFIASLRQATQHTLLIGSFLGECIVAKYGAKWFITEDGKPRLELSAADTVHLLDPFGKVAKCIQNRTEDNLAFYFAEFIPSVIKASR
jgi:hypothetical protein